MNYKLLSSVPANNIECLVIGLFEGQNIEKFDLDFSSEEQQVLLKLRAKLSAGTDMVWQADFFGKSLLLIDFADAKAYNLDILKKKLGCICASLLKHSIKKACLVLPALADYDADKQLETMLLYVDNFCYQFLELKTKDNKAHQLKELCFYLPKASETSLSRANAIASSVRFVRDLANLPANLCTPTIMADKAIKMAQEQPGLSINIIDKKAMQEMGMGALLAVSQGSIEEPKLIELQYHGAGNAAPVVLVGKGITFDSGGLSLKPKESMNEMKFDMAGAACVLGVLRAAAMLKLPINLIGLAACAENLPSGSAVKPGDVIKTMSGQTVEIINTDAEGRLVLADALCYAERFKPEYVVDIATLTGAIIISLGSLYNGLMTEDNGLAQLLIDAGNASGDKVWRLPMDEDYQKALDSNVADMINARFERAAGSITAACFLSRYTKNFRWAHLDIAGTAWKSGNDSLATGRPVYLLLEFLQQVIHAR